MIKNLPPSEGYLRDMGSIPGLGRSPGGGHENSFPRSLVGYGPQGHKEPS